MTSELGPIGARLGLGPIDQIGFVVHSVDAAMPLYESMFGPFTRREVSLPAATTFFRGQPTPADLVLAFGSSGGIEIELIEVRVGQTPHSEHLARYGEGLHHVRFRVTDLHRQISLLEAGGFETTFRGGVTRRFAYLSSPAGLSPSEIELIEADQPDMDNADASIPLT